MVVVDGCDVSSIQFQFQFQSSLFKTPWHKREEQGTRGKNMAQEGRTWHKRERTGHKREEQGTRGKNLVLNSYNDSTDNTGQHHSRRGN